MRRWLPLALALGCHSSAPAPACDGVSGLVVTRVAEHPGGGDEVTARLRFDTGVPIVESDLVQCLSVEGAPAADVSIAARSVDTAYTLLLVDPGASRRDADNATSLVQEIVMKRPAGEPIAIFRWGRPVTQIVGFDDDRRLLLERVAVGLVPSDDLAPAGEALAAATAALNQAGGAAGDVERTIVLVGPRAAGLVGLGPAVDAAAPHLVVWLGGADQEGQAMALPRGLRFPIGAQTVPAQVVSAMSDRLDAYQHHAHYAVGLCEQAARSLQLRFQALAPTALTMPPALAEDASGACQAGEIAAGHRRFPARLDLELTDDQRAAAATAFADPVHRPPFALSVRLAPDASAMPATARYRGGPSYGCDRRSYALELDGEAARFLFPDAAGRRFELISMCLDRMYLRTFATLSLLASEGLYRAPFDLVEVAVDGVSQGPYLVVEDAADALRTRVSRLGSVVRRTATGDEIRWSATGDAEAQAAYDALGAAGTGLVARRLESAFEALFDLQGYLTWVALMNLVDSAGYADQLLFYGAESTGPDGAVTSYAQPMGLDEDGAFTGCSAGARSIVDPNGLLGCAESDLDRRIFTDSLLYARYAEVLSSVLERQPTERFAGFARAAATRVLAFLASPDARAGLTELRTIEPAAVTDGDAARALLESELGLLIAEYDARRAALLDRLARFRGQQ